MSRSFSGIHAPEPCTLPMLGVEWRRRAARGPLREIRVERRLTAILAADVARYSRLTGMDEEGTHSRPEAQRVGYRATGKLKIEAAPSLRAWRHLATAVCLNAIDNDDGDRPAISGFQEQATIRARPYRSGDSVAYFFCYDLNFAVSVHWLHTIAAEMPV
jgi:hypothetical protein